ncbi:MAG: hypothetical protein GYB65_21045 [Chloroflexi bacterium]|nr:hypothetical protein [Chloroflexota bacterium]
MPKPRNLVIGCDEVRSYHIRIKGHLGGEWSSWFEGMTIIPDANGETVLTGVGMDQAALFGALKKVRDLGMPLISVVPVEPDRADKAPKP